MNRRDTVLAFLALGTAPLAALAQQRVPLIGYLTALNEAQSLRTLPALRRGLNEAGFVEGKSIAIDYRYADGQYDRLPALAAELVRNRVSLIIAAAPPAALAAKAATTTIPIVFVVGVDPVAAGLVASFNRPGGNATGMTLITGPLGQKRLELLRELVPNASVIAMLVNPTSPDAVPEIRDVMAVAQANKLALRTLNASVPGEIDAAFASLEKQKPDALLVGSDPFFNTRRRQIITLAARLGVPTAYPFREFPSAGGLLSYGASLAGAYRQAGLYAGRILKGAKPADLPVLQPATFELVLNRRTAKALGLAIPNELLLRADEVIE